MSSLVDWHEVNISKLREGQQITGFEHPKQWDAFARPVSRQMLALFYEGTPYTADEYVGRDALSNATPEAATTLERQMALPIISHAYDLEDLRLSCTGVNDKYTGKLRGIEKIRPNDLDAPYITSLDFVGVASLRSKSTSEIIGAAGVLFYVQLEQRKRPAHHVVARRKCATGPSVGITIHDVHPNAAQF